MNKPVLLVLAAGMGSRYGGLKQLDGVGPNGETIMDYSVYDAVQAGFGRVVFVIRKFFRNEFESKVKNRYGKIIDIEFVEQELDVIPAGFSLNPLREKPWGTGHAVIVASSVINSPFAVINADDFYGRNSFKVISAYLSECRNKRGHFSMVGFCTGNTLSESGSVSRGVCTVNNEGFLESVEEHHNIKRFGNIITGENGRGETVILNENNPVSMNMWGFTPDIFEQGWRLFSKFMEEKGDEPKSEFYIPFIVNKLLEEGYAKCKVLSSPDCWFGVTYKEDRDSVRERIKVLCKKGEYPVPLF